MTIQDDNLTEARSRVRYLKEVTTNTFGQISLLLFPGGPHGPVSSQILPAQNTILKVLEDYESTLIKAQNAIAANRARTAQDQDRAVIDTAWRPNGMNQ